MQPMTDHNTITPPPELVDKWNNAEANTGLLQLLGGMAQTRSWRQFLTSARMADTWEVDNLRAIRRPKPPNLKEQALEALDDVEFNFCTGKTTDIIRRALEQLPDPTSETH
jgi:hypothetical protein